MVEHPDTRAGRLAAALDEFIHSSPDVEAAAVVSFDGLPMASALPDELEEDRVGAMSAALLSLGEQAAIGLGRGQLNQIFVEGDDGFVFLMSARDEAVLTAIARRTAKIGFMLFEMRRAADRIGRALQAPITAYVDDTASPPPPVTHVEEPPRSPRPHGDEPTYPPRHVDEPAGPPSPTDEPGHDHGTSPDAPSLDLVREDEQRAWPD